MNKKIISPDDLLPQRVEKANIAAIREKLARPQDQTKPDDSRVIIAEMQINALKELSNNDNRIFSQINDNERWDVARCLEFWEKPLPGITRRLYEKYGIEENFNSIVVPKLIAEHLSLGHFVGRQRVTEYIDGLRAVAPKNGIMQEDPTQKRSLLSRMI
jgi:hypothetical protein